MKPFPTPSRSSPDVSPCPDARCIPAAVEAVAGSFMGCPDCGNRQLSYRVTDEDTGCSYPLDDGEHFCSACDCVWLDEDVHEPLPGYERRLAERIEADLRFTLDIQNGAS